MVEELHGVLSRQREIEQLDSAIRSARGELEVLRAAAAAAEPVVVMLFEYGKFQHADAVLAAAANAGSAVPCSS